MALRAEFEQPTDYSKSNIELVHNEYVFQIEMIDPCFTSVLDPFIIDDITRAVKQSQKS